MRLLAFKPANYIELDETQLGKSTEQDETVSATKAPHDPVSQVTTEPVASPIRETSPVDINQVQPASEQLSAELPVSQPVKEEITEPVVLDAQIPEQSFQPTIPDMPPSAPIQEEVQEPLQSMPPSAPIQEEVQAPQQSMPEQVDITKEVPLQVDPQQSVKQLTSSRNMLRSHRLKRNEIKSYRRQRGLILAKMSLLSQTRPENEKNSSDNSIKEQQTFASDVVVESIPNVQAPIKQTHQEASTFNPQQEALSSQSEEKFTNQLVEQPEKQPDDQANYSFEDSYMDQFSDSYQDAYSGNDYDPYIPPEEMQSVVAQPQERSEQAPTQDKLSKVVEPEILTKPLTESILEPIIEPPLPEPKAITAKSPVELNDTPLGKHPFFSAQEVESVDIDKAKYVEDKLTDPWSLAIQQMQIQGFAKLLAKHSVMKKTHDQIILTLKASQQHLLSDGKLCEELQAQLKNHFGAQYNMYIEVGNVEGQLTPFESEEALYEQYLINAKHAIIEDENIKALVNNCGAKVYENSVIPL
ncbi:DNA polymerase III subunit gamma/tau C-terminal domain-containing protein [Psychromonas sp. KJ10-10]|uniref:DNA polymerase III subunit gamma/tau C-terminal domain-containing protein n=1 Tax=Psychromonas sp. KJ10-10 TaxID=3391823 RepID=UPI0039B5D850